MSIENRNIGTYTEVDVVKQSIDQANQTSLLSILHSYSVRIDDYERMACCPLPHHKGGQEHSASFHFYPETNSFYCFGCKSGGCPVDFVSLAENISRYQASVLINEEYEVDTSQQMITKQQLNCDSFYLEFADNIRTFLLAHNKHPGALKFAEQICVAFDTLVQKYSIGPDGLSSLVGKLKARLDGYQDGGVDFR